MPPNENSSERSDQTPIAPNSNSEQASVSGASEVSDSQRNDPQYSGQQSFAERARATQDQVSSGTLPSVELYETKKNQDGSLSITGYRNNEAVSTQELDKNRIYESRLNQDGSLTVTQRDPDGSYKENTTDQDGNPVIDTEGRKIKDGSETTTRNHLLGQTVISRQLNNGDSSTTVLDRTGQTIFHGDFRADGSRTISKLGNNGEVTVTETDNAGKEKETIIDSKGIESSEKENGKVISNSRANYDGTGYLQTENPDGTITVNYKGEADKNPEESKIDPFPAGSVDKIVRESELADGEKLWSQTQSDRELTYNGSRGCAVSGSTILLRAEALDKKHLAAANLRKELAGARCWEKQSAGSSMQAGDVGVGHDKNNPQTWSGGYAHIVIGAGNGYVWNNTNRPQGGEGEKSWQKERQENALAAYPDLEVFRRKAYCR